MLEVFFHAEHAPFHDSLSLASWNQVATGDNGWENIHIRRRRNGGLWDCSAVLFSPSHLTASEHWQPEGETAMVAMHVLHCINCIN